SLFCAEKALDKKALSLQVFDMRKRNAFADFTVICSATSSRHASSIAQGIVDAVKEKFGMTPMSFEGAGEGQWVLIDFGAVIVHVFESSVRQTYRIEDLLKNCPQIQKEVPGLPKTEKKTVTAAQRISRDEKNPSL